MKCLLLLAIFSGCYQPLPHENDNIPRICFEYHLTGMLMQDIKAPGLKNPGAQRSIDYGSGQLTVIHAGSGTEEVYSWYFTVDVDTFEMTSEKTIVLSPGTYHFLFDLPIHNYQYAGSVTDVVIVDGENSVPVTVRPVIGDTTIAIDLEELASLRFAYPPEEIAILEFPRLGYILDGNNEMILFFNPATGVTDTYIVLEPGAHTLQLKLYDGNTQKGKSVPLQETINVVPARNITMDIVPLYGETAFELTMDGGEALFAFTIPAEIVEEVDGTENLTTYFMLYGFNNGLREEEITYYPSGTEYKGEVLLEQFHYDTVTITLTFIDQRNLETIGACGKDEIVLDMNTRNVVLPLVLYRRALITGHLMGVVGVFVVDADRKPVEGVSVYSDEVLAGLTGSGVFGTAGYLKVYLVKGEHQVKVMKDGYEMVQSFVMDTMGISNIEFVLDMTL